jgi:CDP-glucose 4,6-dehydratase
MSFSKKNGIEPAFWSGKRVFITGHTGFKGSWLSIWLANMGAQVTGYALAPNTSPNLYEVLDVGGTIYKSHIGDIIDISQLREVITDASPEIVLHMAAQPLVRYSYEHPVETYSTNVMGTVNLLECVRALNTVRAVVVVTTDKCYENKEWEWGYREIDALGGHDPYSSSKGCAELVTAAYRESYFPAKKYHEHRVAIASARAGNVIGGGDWSADRLIPDAFRAFEAKRALVIRNTLATRPWQHVLEPLSGYLILAKALYLNGTEFNGGWNFGPKNEDARSVNEVINLLMDNWKFESNWIQEKNEQPHEANSLILDFSKSSQHLGWTPKWGLEKAIKETVGWQHALLANANMKNYSLKQINRYALETLKKRKS